MNAIKECTKLEHSLMLNFISFTIVLKQNFAQNYSLTKSANITTPDNIVTQRVLDGGTMKVYMNSPASGLTQSKLRYFYVI